MNSVKLEWKALVDSVEAGECEPIDPATGKTRFMYCKEENTFVTDPFVIDTILRARSHPEAHLLGIAPVHTGIESLVYLIASGDPKQPSRLAVDRIWISEESDEEACKQLFSRKAFFDRHRTNAVLLIVNFDRALEYEKLSGAMYPLVKHSAFTYYGDTKQAQLNSVRLVVSTPHDISDALQQPPHKSFFQVLYDTISERAIPFGTRTLSEQLMDAKRGVAMQPMLAAAMAKYYLSSKDQDTKAAIDSLAELVTPVQMDVLSKHTWPNNYITLNQFVATAVQERNWDAAIGNLLGELARMQTEAEKKRQAADSGAETLPPQQAKKVAVGDLEKGAGTETGRQDAGPSLDGSAMPSQYVFEKRGAKWRVAFEGHETWVDHSEGMNYLCILLASPGTPFYPHEIEDECGKMRVRNQRDDTIVDERTRTELKQTQSQLEEIIIQAESVNDAATLDEARQEKVKVDAALSSVQYHGRSRQFSDHREKARVAVGKALKVALDAIDAQGTASFAKHLHESLPHPAGKTVIYAPRPPVAWRTSGLCPSPSRLRKI